MNASGEVRTSDDWGWLGGDGSEVVEEEPVILGLKIADRAQQEHAHRHTLGWGWWCAVPAHAEGYRCGLRHAETAAPSVRRPSENDAPVLHAMPTMPLLGNPPRPSRRMCLHYYERPNVRNGCDAAPGRLRFVQ